MTTYTAISYVFSTLTRSRYLVPLSMACFLTSACGVATFDGEADLLQLQVVHPDNAITASLGAILAEGTQVQMRAIIKDGDQPGKISAIDSTDKTVLNIESFDQNLVTLDALKAGNSQINLTVKNADDEALEDVIPLEVRKVASTVVTPNCKDGAALTNGTIDLRYSMRDDAGKRLTGYGFYPLSFEPAGPVIDQDYKFVEHVRILTGPTAGTFALQSTLPTTAMNITVVNPAEVTKLADINYDPEADPTILSLQSEPSPVAAYAIETANKSVCGDSEHIQVDSLTPERCSGQLKALGSLYILTVTPLEEGECTLDVQLLDVDQTVLHSQQHTISITS